MLTDAEFAKIAGIDVEEIDNISDDVAPFSWFSLEYMTETQNGQKRKVDLWKVKQSTAGQIADLRKQQRQENLARYVEQGFAFDEKVLDPEIRSKDIEENDDDDELEAFELSGLLRSLLQ